LGVLKETLGRAILFHIYIGTSALQSLCVLLVDLVRRREVSKSSVMHVWGWKGWVWARV